MSAFLQIKLENRRPIPLMAVIANIMFRVPSMFVFWTRRICWNLSGETSDILFVRIYQSKWKTINICMNRTRPWCIQSWSQNYISLELVWELEYDFLSGEFLVDVAESFQFVFNISLHGFVEVDLEIRIEIKVQNLWFRRVGHVISTYLEKSGGVKSDTGSLSDNFGREAQIIQDSIVDRSQSSAEWSLLLLVFGLTGWFWQDSSLK